MSPVMFKDQPFTKRLDAMGDEAEGVFDEVYPNGKERFGLCRPQIRLHQIPLFIRYMPDRIVHDRLVEVQGFGRDRTVKIKTEKLTALLFWDSVWTCDLWLWDTTMKRYTQLPIRDVLAAVNSGRAELRYFPEGKAYYVLNADTLVAADSWVNR